MNINNEFVHLKIHSEYSIVDSIIKIDNLIKKAKEFNMKSLAITDFMNLFGIIKFYESCIKNNIKPIIGVNVLINHYDEYNVTELTMLSYDNIGYKNLILLLSSTYIDNYYKIPVIDYKELINNNKGLIILSGGIKGYIGKTILDKNKYKLNNYINLYLKHFNDKYYIEISRLGLENEEYYILKSIELSKKFSIPLVATNNVVFLNSNEYEIHNIRVSINERVNNKKIKKKYSKNQYFKNSYDMNFLFKDIPESIINTIEISKRCNLIIDLNNNYYIPKFYKKYNSSNNYLSYISNKKLNNKLSCIFSDNNVKEYESIYKNRLNKELNIISKMGFSEYFIIVMDFIDWAKKNNIPVGPGRGSGTGSLVSYVLNITELDPIKFNLIFERFLNPERISMPDFDIDFCIKKRDFVINYVINKYGKEFVSQIITFGTMTAKSVIKDVGRSLGYPYVFINKISKLIPNHQGFNLIDIFKINEFLILYNNNKDIKNLINISLKLEGIVKNIGKHAGGIVISPSKITNFVPIYNSNNSYITQFDKYDIEKIGLIKFDFLGLKTLTIIDETIKLINNNSELKINISNISLLDKKSFKLLKSTLTTAVFQLESKGIKNIIKRLKPDNFEDIIALIALFRPGPLQSGMVDNFINRKNGLEKIYYPSKNLEHNILKSILCSTYGIILYQEQIIQIAQKFSNYTLAEADLFRISISRKNKIDMKKQKDKFINGAIINKIDIKLANKIFDIIEKFAGYGFNKSHSSAYALISYRTLWLKSNYTIEYIISVMNYYINDINKINNLINDCKNFKINIINVDINISLYKFHINYNKEIVYGIGAIKGIGESFVKKIIENRDKYGKFKNFIDLCKRINLYNIGKKNLDILIKFGALESIGINKNNNSLEKYIEISKKYFSIIENNQIDMFGLLNNKT